MPLTAPDPQGPALGRLAAIDVGSNTIRLVVVEVAANRTYRVLDDEKDMARLARGLSDGDAMRPEVMAEAAQTIARFRAIAEGYGVAEIRAAATWAVRRAVNGPDFVAMVKDRAGLDLVVLSAEEEARLAFLGVRHTFDLSAMTVAVMDVGGGSTELVLGTGEVIDRIYPLPLGSVGLTERFGQGGGRYRAMRQYVRRALERRVGRPPVVPHLLIGTGGTFTTLAAISMHRGTRGRDATMLPFNVRGYELQRSEVKHLLEQLRKMSLRERSKVPGLSSDRADIIVAGLSIVERVLKHFDVNRIRVADQGIRAGVVQAMIDARWPRPAPGAGAVATVDRMRSVRQFAAACGWEASHAEHVADLSGQLFDQLAADRALGDGGWSAAAHRELLIAAALLHDVGYVINYSKHHKHSYHLILHSGLPGFTQRELELIACIARYHRGAHPKPRHTYFARLEPRERPVVQRLAGMLRLAVGLDRSHAQEIRRVRVRCTRRTAFIDVEANGNPSVDLWAGQRHCGLFEESCGRRVRFRWAPTDGSAAVEEPELIGHASN